MDRISLECWELQQVQAAVKQIFERFDVTYSGALSRADYDLLLVCTDGEASDDDTWAYISGWSSYLPSFSSELWSS